MPLLILIRHAETQQEPGRSAHDWTLTPEGIARCSDLAHSLAPYQISTLYSSHENKARLTAQHVAQVLGIAHNSAADLHETQRSTAPYYAELADFQEHIRRGMAEPQRVIFGEEAFGAALARFSLAIDALLTKHSQETIGVVTHGTVMSLFLGKRCNLDSYSFWQKLGMPAWFAIELPGWNLLRSVYHLEA